MARPQDNLLSHQGRTELRGLPTGPVPDSLPAWSRA